MERFAKWWRLHIKQRWCIWQSYTGWVYTLFKWGVWHYCKHLLHTQFGSTENQGYEIIAGTHKFILFCCYFYVNGAQNDGSRRKSYYFWRRTKWLMVTGFIVISFKASFGWWSESTATRTHRNLLSHAVMSSAQLAHVFPSAVIQPCRKWLNMHESTQNKKHDRAEGIFHGILLVTPCLLTRIREFIHTQHRNTTCGRRPSVVLRC